MNKKGFTLIELLAVIVILAVIALIATPVIMNAISSAKQGAWKDAAYGIIKATENVYAKEFSETTTPTETFFLYENGVMTSYPAGKTIDYKGSVPQDGGIVLHADGSITLSIHDGVNCAVKTKTASTVTVSSIDKTSCISNIYYKQSTSPFTNLVTNGDFSNGTTGWSGANAIVGEIAEKTNSVQYDSIRFYHPYHETYRGHVIFSKADVKSDSNKVMFTITDGIVQSQGYHSGSGNFETIVTIWTISNTSTTFHTRVQDNRTNNWTKYYIDNVLSIDLTSTFGAGNEPTKEQMDNNLNKVWIDTTNNTPKRFTVSGWINF